MTIVVVLLTLAVPVVAWLAIGLRDERLIREWRAGPGMVAHWREMGRE